MQVVYGDGTFNALIYGEQNPVNTSYFQSQVESVRDTLTEIGSNFMSNLNSIYEEFNNSNILRAARNAIKSVTTLFQPNIIRSLLTIENFQTADTVMQRWVMANPVVREKYQRQLIDGYSDTYFDVSPGKIGENHYDYRRVMDGVPVDNLEEDTWHTNFYGDEIHEGDKELEAEEKFEILSTWQIAELFIRKGLEDPTSPFSNKM